MVRGFCRLISGDGGKPPSWAAEDGAVRHAAQTSADRTIDLTANIRLTSLLMQDDFWRSRIVETITIDRALAAEKKREYQVAPLVEAVKEVLGRDEIDADHMHVALPLAPVSKRIGVGFDVESHFGEAFVLKRHEIARREVQHIRDLARNCSISLPDVS